MTSLLKHNTTISFLFITSLGKKLPTPNALRNIARNMAQINTSHSI